MRFNSRCFSILRCINSIVSESRPLVLFSPCYQLHLYFILKINEAAAGYVTISKTLRRTVFWLSYFEYQLSTFFFYFAKSVCPCLDFDFQSLTMTLGKFDDKENRFRGITLALCLRQRMRTIRFQADVKLRSRDIKFSGYHHKTGGFQFSGRYID